MTECEKVKTVQLMLGECDGLKLTDDVIKVYLKAAENAILKRLYPFESERRHLPFQYETDQCELAVRYISRRGAEGETAHNENSINRTYGSADDGDILARIVPFAKIV